MTARILPDGWVWASFPDVARVDAGLTDPRDHPEALHIAPNHIESRTGKLIVRSTIGEDGVTSPKHRFVQGQLLYSKIRPYLVKAVIAPGDGLCSADMYPIATDLSTKYLLYWMISDEFTDQVCMHQGRSLLPKVNQRGLYSTAVPVAPSAEQARIVTELERRLSHVDAAVRDLRSASHKLTSVRSSILEAVVNGSLLGYDSGLWAAATTGGVTEVRGGIQKQPKRTPKENTLPFLRVANVGRGVLDLSEIHQIEVFEGERDSYGLQWGDLLVVEGNGSVDQIGRAAMWDGSIPDCVHQNHLIRVRPGPEVDASFLALVWNAPSTIDQLRAVASSTSGLHTLSTGKVKSVKLALPPVEDQRRLVAEAERRLSLVQAAERGVQSNLQKAQQLRRSLLAAAFSGRLASQDPVDGSAEALLDHIRAVRTADKSARSPRRPALKKRRESV